MWFAVFEGVARVFDFVARVYELARYGRWFPPGGPTRLEKRAGWRGRKRCICDPADVWCGPGGWPRQPRAVEGCPEHRARYHAQRYAERVDRAERDAV